MSLILARSDDFWADLQRQVDWYRDQAGSEVSTGYVDAVEATLRQLRKRPGLGDSGFRTGRSLPGFVLGASKGPFAAT
jgi:plasmid stabilization system protein ParE